MTQQVKERPIVFSALLVRAILEGRKTQTRRIVNLPRWTVADDVLYMDNVDPVWPHAISAYSGCMARVEAPHGKPGDRLWVKETWGCAHSDYRPNTTVGWYYADGEKPDFKTGPFFKKRQAIHMPRWASRITLEITDVRVQRLSDMTAADCLAEGIASRNMETNGQSNLASAIMYLHDFETAWDSIHGKGAWVANPWVWVYTYRRIA